MKRKIFRWIVLGVGVCCLAFGLQRKHTIGLMPEGSVEVDTVEQIGDADLVVFATYGGVARLSDGQLVRVLSSGGDEGPQACPT